MSKKNVKSQIYSKVADLLDSFANRLARVSQNHAGLERRHNILTGFVGGLRDDVVSLKQAYDARVVGIDARIAGVKEENDKREQVQTLRDQNNVQALHDLRTAAQKSFDLVREDVKTLLQQIQRLNERVGQVESQNIIATKFLQAKPVQVESGLPNGHVWVNKKLTGVYESVGDLEARVTLAETELEALKELRKALAVIAKFTQV
jgi:hypothetical protein